MFYVGRAGIKPSIRRNFKINAFGNENTTVAENLVNLSKATCSFNVSVRDGELTQGYGSYAAQIFGNDSDDYLIAQPDDSISGVWHYKRYDKVGNFQDNRLIVRTKTRRLLSLKISLRANEYEVISENFGQVYSAQNYRIEEEDLLLMATDEGLFTYDGKNLEKVENAPDIVCLCIHGERAFATVGGEGNKLWFSTSLDPTDWTVSAEKGGYVEFAGDGGKLTALISFMGYLFVFREYGIERVSAYSDQSDFTIKKIYSAYDKIIEKTVTLCGDRILFVSETGLKSFDGANVTNLFSVLSINDMQNFSSNCVGTYFKGTYYLSCYVHRINSEKTERERAEFINNNCLLLYEPTTGMKQFISDIDVAGFCRIQTENTGELLFFQNAKLNNSTKLGVIQEKRNVRLGKTSEAYWRTGMTDLGFPEKKKFLKSITLTSKNDITVCALLDGEMIKFYGVKGNSVKLFVNKPFEKLGFYFSTTKPTFQISNPVVTVDMR